MVGNSAAEEKEDSGYLVHTGNEESHSEVAIVSLIRSMEIISIMLVVTSGTLR
jgi:hypothetical protein